MRAADGPEDLRVIGAAPGHGDPQRFTRGRAFAVALARAEALTLIPAQSYPF
jgi:hypothetical protein